VTALNVSTVFSEPTALIELGEGRFAIIDREDFELISQFRWFAEQGKRLWYAKTSIKCGNIWKKKSMHRMIMDTRSGEQCHHRNRDSLDNRKANLLNMSNRAHKALHSNDNLKVIYEEKT